MGTPYLCEIRIVSFNFAPKGWAFCNGQFLPINQNQALFSLLGTTYGGNGQTNFALPNLQSRVPVHMGNGTTLGQLAGESNHTVTISELPAHNHAWGATSAVASVPSPTANLLGGVLEYNSSSQALTAMFSGQLANAGGSQPHENEQPYLVLNFCIALQGIFPSRD